MTSFYLSIALWSIGSYKLMTDSKFVHKLVYYMYLAISRVCRDFGMQILSCRIFEISLDYFSLLDTPINPETLILGGIDKSKCMWSGHTSPSIISTPFHLHSVRSISLISCLLSS